MNNLRTDYFLVVYFELDYLLDLYLTIFFTLFLNLSTTCWLLVYEKAD